MKRYLILILLAGCLLLPVPCAKPAEPVLAVEQVEPKKAPAADAPPTVALPKTITVAKGRLAQLPLSYDGDDVKWSTPAELDVFREYDPDPKRVVLRLIGYEDATVTFVAISCRGGKLSEFGSCVIVVGNGKPVPPGPGPTPPEPTDPLTKSFQDAYDAEPDKAKRTVQLAALTQVMTNAANLVNAKKPDGVFVVMSSKQLADAVHVTTETEVGKFNDGALALVRKAVGAYLNGRLPSKDQLMDGAERAVAMDAYAKVAATLRGVK